MTEQIKEPSGHNRMAALQLIARQSVTRLAEILDSKDEAIATARKELPEAQAEVERLTRMRDFERDAAGTMADQYSILAEERNALKAEVERLRLPAEAWGKLVAFRGTDRNWMNHPETVIDAFEDFLEAAREVRE